MIKKLIERYDRDVIRAKILLQSHPILQLITMPELHFGTSPA